MAGRATRRAPVTAEALRQFPKETLVQYLCGDLSKHVRVADLIRLARSQSLDQLEDEYRRAMAAVRAVAGARHGAKRQEYERRLVHAERIRAEIYDLLGVDEDQRRRLH